MLISHLKKLYARFLLLMVMMTFGAGVRGLAELALKDGNWWGAPLTALILALFVYVIECFCSRRYKKMIPAEISSSEVASTIIILIAWFLMYGFYIRCFNWLE